ncbi:MAG TPA: hypothetical protein V6D48_21305 [Oculatellaceae cyanobacterium]
MQSLKASTRGLARIKQARQRITQEKGWAVDHPKWLEEVSSFLPLVMDYATNLLIAKVREEIETVEIALFNSHAFLKAQALHSLRETQNRLILKPIKDRLLNNLRGKSNV